MSIMQNKYLYPNKLFPQDEASESKMRAAGLVEEVLRLLDRRSGLYNVYMEAISKFKSSKDVASFTNARKKLDSDYRSIGTQISQLQSGLAKEQSEAVEKVRFWNVFLHFLFFMAC